MGITHCAPHALHSEQSTQFSTPPVEKPTDADHDLAILRQIPKQFAVTDDQSANWVCRKVIESREYADRVRLWAEHEINRAVREEKVLLFLFGRQLEEWARDGIDKLKGKKKSINLPAATIGFRSVPTRLVVDDEAKVLSWARANLPIAVTVIEKLAKSIVNDYAEKTGVIPDEGVHVEPAAEKFFIR